MNTEKDLLNWVRLQIFEYPHLKEEINEFVQLAFDEIEAGESRENEINLCINSIKELIEENN